MAKSYQVYNHAQLVGIVFASDGKDAYQQARIMFPDTPWTVVLLRL
jgi:hypothetical protein